MAIELRINGVTKTVDVPADMPLLWVLRDVLAMTGTNMPSACRFPEKER